MVTIFLHQLHDHLKSLRFQISLLVLLLFFVVNGLVFAWRAERLAIEMGHLSQENERRYEEVATVAQAAGNWYRFTSQQLGTEFIAEGGARFMRTTFWVSPETGTVPSPDIPMTVNAIMERYDLVDWALIVRLVLSFLCIVLAYDAVSRELELGTLRILLANPVSRAQFLAGKCLAHLVILLVSVALGSLISLLLLSLSEAFELNQRILQGYGLFLVGASLYISLFLFLAMGVSALTRSSSSSIVVLVLVWAVFIVIVPQVSSIIAEQTVQTPKPWQHWEFIDEVRDGLEKEGVVMRGREEGRADNYAQERRYAQRLGEAEKEQAQIARNTDELMRRQYRVAKAVNLVSPGYAFQYTVEGFLGAGVVRRDLASKLAWQYRDSLRDFFRARDAADPDSPHIAFFGDYMSDKPLDPANIPRLELRRPSLREGLAAEVAPIVILVLEVALCFFFAVWALNRTDIAG